MRFIKTKYGIYQWGTFTFVGKNLEKEFSKTSDTIFQSEVLGDSENIDELCDLFMKEDELDNVMNATIKFSPAIFASRTFVKLMAKKEHLNFIGYIVVERKGVKTLEPVARINTKGEVELL